MEAGAKSAFDVVIENPNDYQEIALHYDDLTMFHDSCVCAFREPGEPVRHTRLKAVGSVTNIELTD